MVVVVVVDEVMDEWLFVSLSFCSCSRDCRWLTPCGAPSKSLCGDVCNLLPLSV
jgi:hypothetical protein